MIRMFVSRMIRLAVVLVAIASMWIMPAARAYVPPQLQKLQAQVDVLQGYVDGQEWLEVQSYIHGPMGLFRRQLAALERKLPQAQQAALADKFEDLPQLMNELDEAAGNYSEARLASTQAKIRAALNDIAAAF